MRIFQLVALVALVALLALPATALAEPDELEFRDTGRDYVTAVHAKLHDRWRTFTDMLQSMPAGSRFHDDGSLGVTVELVVAADGRVAELARTAESALAGFDDAPAELLHDLAMLPAPPPALRSDDGQVHLRWRFERGAGDRDRGAVIEKRLPIEEAIEKLVGSGAAARAAERVEDELTLRPGHAGDLLARLAAAIARHDATAREPARRASAARALGRITGGEALLSTLAGDTDPMVRSAAIASAATVAPSRALLQAIVGGLAGPHTAVSARSLEQLGRRGNPLPIDRAVLRAALVRALPAGRATGEIVEALRSLDGAGEAAAAIAGLLAAPASRTAGLRAAMQLGVPALEEPLVAALKSTPAAEQALLIDALGALGHGLGAGGRSVLLRALGHESAAARAAAARGLAAAGERRAKYSLIEGLSDPEAQVRAACVAAVVALEGEAVTDELFRPLRDPAPSVRAALAAALAAHPIPATAALLRRLRSDSEPVVQAAAQLEPGPAPRAPTAADDLDGRLLHASGDVERSRAAADWLVARGGPVPAVAHGGADASPGSDIAVYVLVP